MAQKVAPEGTTDEELISRVAEGDRVAFDTLYGRYSTPIYTYLNRLLLDKDMVDELFQEVFIKVFSRAKQFRPTVSFKSWVFTIATNQYRDYYKSLKRRIERVTALDQDADPMDKHHSDEHTFMDRELLRIVENGIASLPGHFREVILLKRVQGMTFDEAAEILGVSVRTAKNYAAEATRRLKQYMKEQGLEEELPG